MSVARRKPRTPNDTNTEHERKSNYACCTTEYHGLSKGPASGPALVLVSGPRSRDFDPSTLLVLPCSRNYMVSSCPGAASFMYYFPVFKCHQWDAENNGDFLPIGTTPALVLTRLYMSCFWWPIPTLFSLSDFSWYWSCLWSCVGGVLDLVKSVLTILLYFGKGNYIPQLKKYNLLTAKIKYSYGLHWFTLWPHSKRSLQAWIK